MGSWKCRTGCPHSPGFCMYWIFSNVSKETHYRLDLCKSGGATYTFFNPVLGIYNPHLQYPSSFLWICFWTIQILLEF